MTGTSYGCRRAVCCELRWAKKIWWLEFGKQIKDEKELRLNIEQKRVECAIIDSRKNTKVEESGADEKNAMKKEMAGRNRPDDIRK